jgi:hypothetical protein
VNLGDTFIPSPPYKHLYVVVSDPDIDPDNVVVVNFTSYDPDEEDCCIAEAGEHPYLAHKSCVRYKDGRVCPVSALRHLVASGTMTKHKPLSKELLRRIQEGASESDFLPEGCRKVLEEQGFI